MTIPAIDITMRATFGGLLIKPGFAFDSTVNYDGLNILPDSVLFQDEGQATAGSSTTCQDTSQTWVVDEFVDFRIRNTSDGSEAVITSNTIDTLTFSAGLTGGNNNAFVADHYYVIEVILDAGDQIQYSSLSSLDGNVVINSRGVPSVTGVNGNHVLSYRYVDVSLAETSPDYLLTIVV